MTGRRKLRVLHVNKYSPFVVGGVERVVGDIVNGLPEEFDFRVLACRHRKDRGKNDPRFTRVSSPLTAMSMPLSIQFYPQFRRLARQSDIIHFHHPFPLGELAGLLDGMSGRRIVLSFHSDIVRQKWVMPVYGPVLKTLLRKCDRIILATNRLRDLSPNLREFQSKAVVIPYGVPIEGDGRELRHGNRDSFLLFTGRLVPYKGVGYLIDAMPRIEGELVVVGDGPLRKELQAQAVERGVDSRVRFLGSVPYTRLREYFQDCSMFVLPSVSANEAFGLVQLEAMAFGKPVINTHLPTGVPEVSLDGITGATVPPRNSVALAEAVTRIRGDSGRYEEYCRRSLARAGEFSMEKFLAKVRGLYEELAG